MASSGAVRSPWRCRRALGRGFLPEEEAPGARVVVLSHEVWQTLFGSDPAIVGRSITIDGEPNTVVGVAPAGFTYPIERRPVQIWTTLARDASSGPCDPSPSNAVRAC